MARTKIPLQTWFAAIALTINAKKGISSCQMARDLGMDHKTCWSMQQRIRGAMATEEHQLLRDIVEVDETYIGRSTTRYDKKYFTDPPVRGRGTKKTAVIGAVQRGGKVVAMIAEELTKEWILRWLRQFVDIEDTVIVTDQYPGYWILDLHTAHLTIFHRRKFVDGDVYTNTIEGFWSLVKKAWVGHHHYSKKWMPMYIAEACWKYNHRDEDTRDTFNNFLEATICPQRN